MITATVMLTFRVRIVLESVWKKQEEVFEDNNLHSLGMSWNLFVYSFHFCGGVLHVSGVGLCSVIVKTIVTSVLVQWVWFVSLIGFLISNSERWLSVRNLHLSKTVSSHHVSVSSSKWLNNFNLCVSFWSV